MIMHVLMLHDIMIFGHGWNRRTHVLGTCGITVHMLHSSKVVICCCAVRFNGDEYLPNERAVLLKKNAHMLLRISCITGSYFLDSDKGQALKSIQYRQTF